MSRILRLPLELARFAWSFVDPALKAGRIPLGRVAIVVQIIAALVFVGYTLTKKSIRVPLVSSEPYRVEVIFSDAQGLDRVDEPAAAVAGTPLGQVSEVRYEDGHPIATLTLADEVRGKLFADASAAIRPASALQNLLVNIDPGTPSAGPLPEDQPIPPARTTNYVAIDDLTSILDADTQAYATILLQEAEIALRGRGGELRRALAELGELTETATPVSEALAERRRLLTRLVGELEVVASTLGARGRQLAEAINAGNETLRVTAARELELAEATRELGPMLAEAERAVAALRRLAEPLSPALDGFIEAAGPLAESTARMRELLPRVDELTDQFATLVADGRRPLELMLEGSRGLKRRAKEMVPVMRAMTELARRLDRYKDGVSQTAETLSGAFSIQDRNGAVAPIDILKIEAAKPENFGTRAAAARDRNGPSRLDRSLARALELACRRRNPAACVYRFNVPGLPRHPVTAGGGGG